MRRCGKCVLTGVVCARRLKDVQWDHPLHARHDDRAREIAFAGATFAGAADDAARVEFQRAHAVRAAQQPDFPAVTPRLDGMFFNDTRGMPTLLEVRVLATLLHSSSMCFSTRTRSPPALGAEETGQAPDFRFKVPDAWVGPAVGRSSECVIVSGAVYHG